MQRGGIIVHECVSHSSNLEAMREHATMEVLSFGWLDTGISFQVSKLIYLRSFEKNRQQTYRGSSNYVGWMRGMLVYDNPYLK